MTPDPLSTTPAPVTEADLHAYVDGQLSSHRRGEIAAFLQSHPDALARVTLWQAQRDELQALFNPVMDEPLPLRLPLSAPVNTWSWRSLVAGIVIALVSLPVGWVVRGAWDATRIDLSASDYPRRAAVAHTVYASDMRRPVEIGADDTQSLVTWLTRRLGAKVVAPSLATVGFNLVGGRLLPGESGPVAQLMYASDEGQRLTLYVTREGAGDQTAFQFVREGNVQVFYWTEGQFGYALSGEVDRSVLQRVSEEVYRQLRT